MRNNEKYNAYLKSFMRKYKWLDYTQLHVSKYTKNTEHLKRTIVYAYSISKIHFLAHNKNYIKNKSKLFKQKT